MKGLAIIVGLLAVLGLAAIGSASAERGGGDGKLVLAVEDIGFEFPTAACEEGTVTFSLVSRNRGRIGSGASCIHLTIGCTFAAGCRAVRDVDFTFTFPWGSLTAPIVFREVWMTDTFVRARAKGRIASGTGAFAGAEGSIKCGGTLEFAAPVTISTVVCTVRTRHDDDDDED